MKKFLAILAMVGALGVAPAHAQTVGVPLQVRTGEVYTVHIEVTQSVNVGEQDIAATVSEVLALHILDADNRIWRYTPVSVRYDMPSGLAGEAKTDAVDWAAVSDGASALTRIATDVGFECRVDEYGDCVEMSNWPLWRDRVENLVLMIDAFARAVPAPPAIPETPEGKSAVAAAPEDEAAVEGEATAETAPPPRFNWLLVREPALRGIARLLYGVDERDAAATLAGFMPGAALHGRTLTRRRTENVIEEVEMPFGAPALRFTGTLRLERIDRRNNAAIVVRRVSLDRESARASLRSMAQFITTNLVEPVAAAAAAEGAPDPATFSSMVDGLLDAVNFGYEETATGVVDLATGMARETTTEFTFTLAPPGEAGAGEPLAITGRMVVRVTPGAPEVPRLPRGE